MSDIEMDIDLELESNLHSDDDLLDDDYETDESEGESEGSEDLLDDLDALEEEGEELLDLKPLDNQTVLRLTKYEKTNILGLRATQIQAGSQPFIDIKKLFSVTPLSIAVEELKQRKLDFFKIKRMLPSGKAEILSLKHMKL